MNIHAALNWLIEKGVAEKFNENHDEKGQFASAGGTQDHGGPRGKIDQAAFRLRAYNKMPSDADNLFKEGVRTALQVVGQSKHANDANQLLKEFIDRRAETINKSANEGMQHVLNQLHEMHGFKK